MIQTSRFDIFYHNSLVTPNTGVALQLKAALTRGQAPGLDAVITEILVEANE